MKHGVIDEKYGDFNIVAICKTCGYHKFECYYGADVCNKCKGVK